ncbi:hypothetical protein ACTFIW_003876 [Dictyostelium discoideum]
MSLFTWYGAPARLKSDRGTVFLSGIAKGVNKILDPKKINSTAYHPQLDGQTENFNVDPFYDKRIIGKNIFWSTVFKKPDFSPNQSILIAFYNYYSKSNVFTVPKPGTTLHRPVLDLKRLNTYINNQSFKMEGIMNLPSIVSSSLR